MIKTTDGLNLFTKNYLVKVPKATLLIVHGLAEHCLRYEHLAKAFNAIDIDVYTFDLRGHGQSEGERALIKNISEYREDLENVYRSIQKNVPLFLLGHSMGGLIVTDFLLFNERNDIKGAILSGAALEPGDDITPVTKRIVSLLGKFAPKLGTIKLKSSSISRDPQTVESYDNDPLIQRGATKAGMGLALLNGISEVKSQFKNFDYPVLIMHGSEDKITNLEGSKNLFQEAKTKDKTLKIWDEAFHEIFNEINKNDIIDFTTNWIINRI